MFEKMWHILCVLVWLFSLIKSATSREYEFKFIKNTAILGSFMGVLFFLERVIK